MNSAWPIARLADLCEFFGDGDWIESRDQSAEGIRLVQTGNVGEGSFKGRDEKARYITEHTFHRLRCTEVFEGDCLISRLPDPVGRCCILPAVGERMITAVDCTIVRFKADRVLPQFFCYYSQSNEYLACIAHECTGTTRSRISRSNLGLTPIPLPPLPEQRRIVGILDEAFAAIATAKANTEKNLSNAQLLFDSYLAAVFGTRGEGWTVSPVGEIADRCLGKMLDKAKNQGNFQPYLRNLNVRWFEFDLADLSQMRFLPEEADKYTAVKGDVLICEGGYPGRAAIWNQNYPMYFQKAIHRVRFRQPEHGRWFVYFLYLNDRRGLLRQHFTGTGIQHFTGETLSRFQVPIPPLPVLRQLVADFDELFVITRRLASFYARKIAALEALKKSLLHQAFTGELSEVVNV